MGALLLLDKRILVPGGKALGPGQTLLPSFGVQ